MFLPPDAQGASPVPIDAHLPAILEAIRANPVTLLSAEPGSGKTTRVPPALFQAGFPHLFILEPRRIAARLASRRVAEELSDPLGQTVGYQVRFDRTGSAATRIWFLTEGVFTNRLLSGAPLPPGSVILLDEFHERHLETDLALALLRNLLPARPDLRVVLMSATLDPALPAQLHPAPLLEVAGRQHPLEVRYTYNSAIAPAVKTAAEATAGHILVFLPGSAEIRSAIAECQSLAFTLRAQLLPLYGTLDPAEQDRALAPSAQRKIIFATNVAESSVTVEGVTAVIDSGLARVASHSPVSGLPRLQLARISKSSAVQRGGRAGRTGPGLVLRLYSPEDFARRPESTPPEIARVDWTEPALRLAAAGLSPDTLPWLDTPPTASLQAANSVLVQLGASDPNGQTTLFGKTVARLPLHPRLVVLAFKGAEFGVKAEAAHLAAWFNEGNARPDRRAKHRASSDLDLLLGSELSYSAHRTESQLLNEVRTVKPIPVDHPLEKALLCAFPDRVAARKGDAYLFPNGTGARLDRQSLALDSPFLLALDVDDREGGELPLIRIAIAIEPDWLLDLFPDRLEAVDQLRWNRTAERAEQVSQLRYDRLVLDETVQTPPTASPEASALLVEKALDAGWRHFAEPAPIERLLARASFAAGHGATTIPSENDLVAEALTQRAAGLSSFADLKQASRSSLLPLIEARLESLELDHVAPSHIRLPSGRRAPIEYIPGQPPAVSSRLQDFFGMNQTPALANGAVPLTVKLLAPSGRPVQITTDLASFWLNLYPQLRRELSRQYPRHAWPESPA